MGCRNQTDVDAMRPAATETLELLFLQDTQ
jgi:hypothetical protein